MERELGNDIQESGERQSVETILRISVTSADLMITWCRFLICLLSQELLREAQEALKETRERFQSRRGYETNLLRETFVNTNWRHSLDGNFSCYIRIYPLDVSDLMRF